MRVTASLFAGMLILALGAGGALAQDQYPSRTVKLIVPTSPGAVTDIIARALGQALSQSWGQPFVIDNRPGGDETLGIEATAKSPPDGYTLVLSSNGGITAAPHLHTHIRYNSQKDLTPIFMLGQVTPVMVVPSSSPVKSVQDLIALAKSKPGELNYGSFGTGSYSHVAMEDFKQRTGTQMMHLPYRGAAPAYTALLAKRDSRDDRESEWRHRACGGGHCQDHRRGRSHPVENAARSPDRRRIRCPRLLDRRMVGIVRARQSPASHR